MTENLGNQNPLLRYIDIYGPTAVRIIREDGVGTVPLVEGGKTIPYDEIDFTKQDNHLGPVSCTKHTLDGLVDTNETSKFRFFVNERRTVEYGGKDIPIGGIYDVVVDEHGIKFLKSINHSEILPPRVNEALTESFIHCLLSSEGRNAIGDLDGSQLYGLYYQIKKYLIIQ